MHLRLARRSVASRLTASAAPVAVPVGSMRLPGWPRLTSGLLAGCLVASCATAADGIEATWDLEPGPPATDVPSVARITLHDTKGAAVSGATVRLEAHMSHAGMAPVLAPAVERTRGVYEAPFQFTMAGDWFLVVTGTLADGTRIEERIEVAGVRDAR